MLKLTKKHEQTERNEVASFKKVEQLKRCKFFVE